jgi:hypothetical protein
LYTADEAPKFLHPSRQLLLFASSEVITKSCLLVTLSRSSGSYSIVTSIAPYIPPLSLVAILGLQKNFVIMAELMFGLGQTKKKKTEENKVRQTKKDTYKYQGRPDEGVENQIRAQQHTREKDYKSTQTQTKTDLRDVNMNDTVESEVRKEQHNREKDWKETGKKQKDSNTNFDMARALFN